MINHGTCSRCGFLIECIDTLRCDQHDFLGRHYDPLECIQLLKTEMDKVNKVMVMNGWLRYGGEY